MSNNTYIVATPSEVRLSQSEKEQPVDLLILFSFLTFLFSIIGNGRIFNFDVALTAIGPICLLLIALNVKRVRVSRVIIGTICGFFALGLTIQGLRFEPLQGYALWPLKALLVALFVSYAQIKVGKLQLLLLFGLVLFLIATSTNVSGRAYGVFGPNMLYRFYGVLFFVAFYLMIKREVARPFALLAMFVALAGIVSTGSIGGIAVLIIGLALFARFSIAALLGIIVASFSVAFFWNYILELSLFKKVILKINFDQLTASTRAEGITDILSYDFRFFGRNYDSLVGVWKYGYEYPHNVFVELYAFFGATGIITSFLVAWAFVIIWGRIRKLQCSMFDFVFLTIFTGSNFSGDLSDNYGLIGIALATVVSRSGYKVIVD